MWPATEHLLPEAVLDRLREGAVAADERGVPGADALNCLRDSGYFGLPVPVELEGGGAGALACAAVQRRLAMADPALAIAANMHMFSLGIAVEHWLRHRDACGLLLEAIASQRRIIASAFAEPGLGGTLLHSTVKAARVDGGYEVSGRKSPCSLAADCDLICFHMESERTDPQGLMTALIPAATEGVEVVPTWEALGMRASGSDTIVLNKCFVPDALVFHRCAPGGAVDEVFAAGLVWFCVTTTATYLGVVASATEEAARQLRRARLDYLGSARAELPSFQSPFGELAAWTLTIEAACVAVAARLEAGGDPLDVLPVAIALKHAAVEVCIKAVEGASEIVGGSSYRRASPLARLWRDVQAARFHPPTRIAARQILGRWALGLPFSLELYERPNVHTERR